MLFDIAADCLSHVGHYLSAVDLARLEAACASDTVAVVMLPTNKVVVAASACSGDTAALSWLIHRGAPTGAFGDRHDTPLHALCMWATSPLHMHAISILLDVAGADPDSVNRYGNTPLHYAAANGRLSAMEMLAGRGASPLRKNYYGDSSLHFACKHGNVSLSPPAIP